MREVEGDGTKRRDASGRRTIVVFILEIFVDSFFEVRMCVIAIEGRKEQGRCELKTNLF